MYLSQGPRTVAVIQFESSEAAFSFLFCVRQLSQDAFLSFSLHVTPVRLRSHALASYRAAVCVVSDDLLLTVLFSLDSSYLCPPELTSTPL